MAIGFGCAAIEGMQKRESSRVSTILEIEGDGCFTLAFLHGVWLPGENDSFVFDDLSVDTRHLTVPTMPAKLQRTSRSEVDFGHLEVVPPFFQLARVALRRPTRSAQVLR
jgi:hypothetical protein